jgi:hypothetical protein
MRKIILLSILFALTLVSALSAQLSFSTDHYKYYRVVPDTVDTSKNNYILMKEELDNSIFHINKNYTMFTHQTSSLQSAYYVQGKGEYVEEDKSWAANVMSDAGNTYFYIFDVENEQIRAVIHKKEETFLIVYFCKSIFVRKQ